MKETNTKIGCSICGVVPSSQTNGWIVGWQCANCGMQNYTTINSKKKPVPLRTQTPQKPQNDVKKTPSHQKKYRLIKKDILRLSITFLLVAVEFSLLVVNLLYPNPIAFFLSIIIIIVLILWVFAWGRNIRK